MQITKAIFDQIAPGEIFRVVTTRFHNTYNLFDTELTFVCLKGRSGLDWAIYAGECAGHPNDIARYGDKVQGKGNILSICPCEEDVFELYRK